ncbi:hypothetical protein B296_00036178 [Ensete ventricosum]|uniref:Uncharacterized protein n=1 Tax=Ensete ventricosum TaxID=4639 RepID=A0A426X2Z7_ENSVE|nr:hypothetical protein B296_00036178 [Ensete ventricosum]
MLPLRFPNSGIKTKAARKGGGRPWLGPLQGWLHVARATTKGDRSLPVDKGRHSPATSPQGVGAHRGSACGHRHCTQGRRPSAREALAGTVPIGATT